MKQMLVAGTMILAATMTIGCSSESERMASMAERMVSSQNEVNSSVVRTNETFVDLNKDLQQERMGLQDERRALNEQFETLTSNVRLAPASCFALDWIDLLYHLLHATISSL